MQKTRMPLITVSSQVENITAAAKQINAILSRNLPAEVQVAALNALATLAEPKPVTISHCTFRA